ncbi:putative integral membrane protein [Daldinia decipiens]|uniref:putative integral membrane protein n=1 Tax=Daldinia decipiens TaxID=326647 RepID=UPI0020C38471|nr:putative integral membrane protein [Daldinia decipiens]KAI1662331.1 putative integral membrane protein [Daldinia decipiens]
MDNTSLSTILPFIPVISTTCSLWFAWDQYEFLTLFRKPDLRLLSNQLLPSYFTTFFNRGVPRVLGLLSATVFSCGAILRYSPGTILRDRGAHPWYTAGLLFALGHLIWAPFIIPPIRALRGDAKGKNVAELERWLYIHVWRSLTVDLAAWVCCIVATHKLLFE